jgi:hypothetical protein
MRNQEKSFSTPTKSSMPEPSESEMNSNIKTQYDELKLYCSNSKFDSTEKCSAFKDEFSPERLNLNPTREFSVFSKSLVNLSLVQNFASISGDQSQ